MPGKPKTISNAIRTKLREARVARLATLDADHRPHLVPVCFVQLGSAFYTAVDRKPKRVAPENLARLRNVRAAPQVALLIDHYDDDWERLWYVMVRGKAKLLAKSARAERARVVRELRAKYPQYAAGMLPDEAPILRIAAERITSWGRL
jgi:PPOX class probable F420-dependent enzyme